MSRLTITSFSIILLVKHRGRNAPRFLVIFLNFCFLEELVILLSLYHNKQINCTDTNNVFMQKIILVKNI
jgi:hypothetical protein